MEDENKRKWEYLSLGLDPDDMELLSRMSGVEKLTKSDVIRRSIRAYAKVLLTETSPQSKVA